MFDEFRKESRNAAYEEKHREEVLNGFNPYLQFSGVHQWMIDAKKRILEKYRSQFSEQNKRATLTNLMDPAIHDPNTQSATDSYKQDTHAEAKNTLLLAIKRLETNKKATAYGIQQQLIRLIKHRAQAHTTPSNRQTLENEAIALLENDGIGLNNSTVESFLVSVNAFATYEKTDLNIWQGDLTTPALAQPGVPTTALAYREIGDYLDKNVRAVSQAENSDPTINRLLTTAGLPALEEGALSTEVGVTHYITIITARRDELPQADQLAVCNELLALCNRKLNFIQHNLTAESVLHRNQQHLYGLLSRLKELRPTDDDSIVDDFDTTALLNAKSEEQIDSLVNTGDHHKGVLPLKIEECQRRIHELGTETAQNKNELRLLTDIRDSLARHLYLLTVNNDNPPFTPYLTNNHVEDAVTNTNENYTALLDNLKEKVTQQRALLAMNKESIAREMAVLSNEVDQTGKKIEALEQKNPTITAELEAIIAALQTAVPNNEALFDQLRDLAQYNHVIEQLKRQAVQNHQFAPMINQALAPAQAPTLLAGVLTTPPNCNFDKLKENLQTHFAEVAELQEKQNALPGLQERQRAAEQEHTSADPKIQALDTLLGKISTEHHLHTQPPTLGAPVTPRTALEQNETLRELQNDLRQTFDDQFVLERPDFNIDNANGTEGKKIRKAVYQQEEASIIFLGANLEKLKECRQRYVTLIKEKIEADKAFNDHVSSNHRKLELLGMANPLTGQQYPELVRNEGFEEVTDNRTLAQSTPLIGLPRPTGAIIRFSNAAVCREFLAVAQTLFSNATQENSANREFIVVIPNHSVVAVQAGFQTAIQAINTEQDTLQTKAKEHDSEIATLTAGIEAIIRQKMVDTDKTNTEEFFERATSNLREELRIKCERQRARLTRSARHLMHYENEDEATTECNKMKETLHKYAPPTVEVSQNNDSSYSCKAWNPQTHQFEVEKGKNGQPLRYENFHQVLILHAKYFRHLLENGEVKLPHLSIDGKSLTSLFENLKDLNSQQSSRKEKIHRFCELVEQSTTEEELYAALNELGFNLQLNTRHKLQVHFSKAADAAGYTEHQATELRLIKQIDTKAPGAPVSEAGQAEVKGRQNAAGQTAEAEAAREIERQKLRESGMAAAGHTPPPAPISPPPRPS